MCGELVIDAREDCLWPCTRRGTVERPRGAKTRIRLALIRAKLAAAVLYAWAVGHLTGGKGK